MDVDAYLKDLTKSISDKTKVAILANNGDNDPDPATLADGKKMSDFNFDNADYEMLTDLFDEIVQAIKPTAANLNSALVKAAAAVKDCVALVKQQST